MQPEFFLPRERGAHDPVRAAEAEAHRALGKGGGLLSLMMASLLLLLVGFAVYFFTAILGEVLYAYTHLPVSAIDVLCIAAATVLLLVAALPLLVGRLRMAGLVAMGETPQPGEVVYYYTTPACFARGLWLGVMYALSLATPLVLTGGGLLLSFLLFENVLLLHLEEVLAITLFVMLDLVCAGLLFLFIFLAGAYFCATAIAVGNAHCSPLAALTLAFSATRGKWGTVFRFVLRAVWHFLISVPTLGILWVCYFAHHTTVGYVALCRELCGQTGVN